MNLEDQAVKPPKPSARSTIEQLGYVESFDAVVDKMYAYVAYKETKADGKWVIRIKPSVTVGTLVDPNSPAIKKAITKAFGHEQKFAVWGHTIKPKEGDPRLVETRILVDKKGNPSAVEVHVITRKADSSAREPAVMSVPWPVPEKEA